MDVAAEFNRAYRLFSIHEGGYVNDPVDPGGETNRGVTKAVYDAYRRRKGLPKQSVKLITDAEVREIFKRQYWDAVRADDLPPGVGYAVTDGAINSGPKQAAKWLQRALRPVYKGPIDGDIGEGTLAAVWAYDDHDKLLARMLMDHRMPFLKGLKTWYRFGNGWTNRVNDVLRTGQAWANGSVGPTIEYRAGGEAKASVSDAPKPPSTAAGDAAVAGGIGSGGVTGTLNQLQSQLPGATGDGGWIDQVVVGLIVLTAVLTLGGFAWNWYSRRRQKEYKELYGADVKDDEARYAS